MHPVNRYLEECLIPRLRSYISDIDIINTVSSDIENRLLSLIYRWNDIDFRHTIFVTVIEEAMFYKPVVSLDIRCLVVLAVRNSLIEELHTSEHNCFDLKKPLIDDKAMQVFTKEAIQFFSNLDLSSVATETQLSDNDPYGHLPNEYQVAWTALKSLSELSESRIEYDFPSFPSSPLKLPQKIRDSLNKTYDDDIIVKSGMDPEINEHLAFNLLNIQQGEMDCFFTDSFKMITRHPDKLFNVIEFVLRLHCPVVTSNYYISNGYVSRRKKLLQADHDPEHIYSEKMRKMGSVNDLASKHQQVLQQIKDQLIQQLVHNI